jgi:hypothetical protein
LERHVVEIPNAEPDSFEQSLQLLVITPGTLAFDWLDGEALDEKALLFRGINEKRETWQATLDGLKDKGYNAPC